MQLAEALFRISITLLLITTSYAQISDDKEEVSAQANDGEVYKIPLLSDPIENNPVPWPFQYLIPFQNVLNPKPASANAAQAAPAPGARPSSSFNSRPTDRTTSAHTIITATIYQLKTAIELVHLRHAGLVNFIRCSIPVIPETCSKYEPKPFVWNWSLFIPPGFTVESFFEIQVPEQFTAIFSVFKDVLEHLHDLQKLTLGFIYCSCHKNTTCAAQPELQQLFPGGFQNIFGSQIPTGGWGTGANKPSIYGIGGSKPISAPFNQGNTTGYTYTGTIDGSDGKPSGSYSGSVYGGPNSGGSYSSFSSVNRPFNELWPGNVGNNRPQGIGGGNGIGNGLGSGIGIGSGIGNGIGSGLGGGIGSGLVGGNRPQGLGSGGLGSGGGYLSGSGGDLLGLGVDGSLYGSAIGVPLGLGGGIYGGVRPQEGGLLGNAGGGLGALLGGNRPQGLFGGLNGLFGGGRPQGGDFGGGIPLGLGGGVYGGGGTSGLEAGVYGGTVPGLFGEISGGIGPRPHGSQSLLQNRPGGVGGGIYSHPELGGQGFASASGSGSSAGTSSIGSSEGGSIVSASSLPDKGSAATEAPSGIGLSFNINLGENKTLSNS